jgi:hypothetical protein
VTLAAVPAPPRRIAAAGGGLAGLDARPVAVPVAPLMLAPMRRPTATPLPPLAAPLAAPTAAGGA